MTPAMLATFAASDAGKLYGRSCERYGIDPARDLEDDVLAVNLRLAMMLADLPEPENEGQDDASRDNIRALEEDLWRPV